MRVKLAIAMLGLVVFTLVLSSLSGLLLIRRASVSTVEKELYSEVSAMAHYPRPGVIVSSLHTVKYLGRFRTLSVFGIDAEGDLNVPLPSGVQLPRGAPKAVLHGRALRGHTGNLIYVVIPLDLSASQRARVTPSIPPRDAPVLVAVRELNSPVDGVNYFFLVSLISIAVAAGVAYWLAKRFSEPLVSAAEASRRIAAGNLDESIDVTPHDMPEFARLATAINSMASDLTRARDQQRQFLLSISHDLRTPLTSIRAYGEALADGAVEDIGSAAEVIVNESNRLERLVGDLLDLARLGAKRFSLDFTRVEVVKILTETVEARSVELNRAKSGLDLTLVRCDTSTAWIRADRDRLVQTLSNLLDNAIRYARSQIAVTMSVDGGYVVINIEDDGPGIPRSDLAQVFEPHFTSDRRRDSRSGTGLGLAIVSELIRAMGGEVYARSPVAGDHGTTMVVYLPTVR